MKLENKTALVTGAGTGIGLGIAKRFAAEGAHVFVTGRRKEVLDDAVAEIGGSVRAIRADSSNLADLDEVYRAVAERGQGLDVVVANSGGGVTAPLGEITEEQFDGTFGTNVKGVLFTVQKALPLLNDKASIILTGSTTSTRVAPGMSVYAATKAAVRNFARTWALDLQGRGVRVNVLSPGPTLTPGLLGLAEPGAQQAMVEQMASAVPLGRLGDPAEIAAAALFLATDEASFVNGVEFFVDGGQAQV
ncbi:NAD(P)-dependent dehydrogenase, short-chain alcohol dehydrogenase family [Amycolatopsis pretoriensis]|uniref:NAD(P)-dependent dehydrogenase, short-chain alcohol dehydrogenase family n=1 Tax=Amycolatopsis pretoriensis TaxID=218821 RepID=A0A1H5RCZ3_9PSEU|nr:SDR family oxidoreductase [Amycolatopsis pretoriensis]SEF35367.1 NAD(P)-dependent dehydrogenase, short-chain alcohol dehydrogenase family [Amycolatopsis pretoriensis]